MAYNKNLNIGSNNVVNISGSLITVTGSLSAGGNATIDTSSDVFAALRITQRGAGHSLLVEDITNPDTSPFVIDNVGYVGIGNTTPTSKLSVDAGSSNVVASSIGASISAAEWSGIHFGYTEPTNAYKKSVIAFERLDAAARGTIHILNNNAFSSANAALADARVSITSAGNVGIGTTVPNFTLAVTGTLGVSGSTTLSTISGTTAQFTFVSASVVSASQYLGLNLTASQISGSELNIDYIDFVGQEPAPAYQSGRMYYNGSGSYSAATEITDLNINLGQQVVLRCLNKSGIQLNRGTVVHIISSSNPNASDTPTISTASYSAESSSAQTLGVVASNITNNSTGYVLLYGVLTNFNTNGYAIGDMLYLSETGSLTTTPPVAPKHNVRIGQVVRANSNGSIFVRVQNGYELDEIHDVLITNKQNGDLITQDSATGLWKNTKTLSGSYALSGSLTSNGTITCLSLVETSTRRIKKDIYSMQSQIENIKKLNPVNYVRILDNKQEFGFIAEELKEVYPEFVIGDGVNYPKMVSVLVSAVQELTQKIEKQQDEIELLKNKKKTTRGKK